MDIELSIEDTISALDRRYKDRERYSYLKNIDTLVNKIDILSEIREWIFFVENEYLECYTTTVTQEHGAILEEAEFYDERSLYFLYKILLEIYEFHKTSIIRIKVYKGKNKFYAYKHSRYFKKIVNQLENINLTETEKIDKLDKLCKEIDYDRKIKIHGNTKSVSAYLLGIKKFKSFRVNTKDELTYIIRYIQKDETKVIPCPVCGDKKKLLYNNKYNIFKKDGANIIFNCNHLESKYYGKYKITIPLKEYKKNIKKIDEIDWVIYNYPYLFKLFKNSLGKDKVF